MIDKAILDTVLSADAEYLHRFLIRMPCDPKRIMHLLLAEATVIAVTVGVPRASFVAQVEVEIDHKIRLKAKMDAEERGKTS